MSSSSSSIGRVARKRALARAQIIDAAAEVVRRDGVPGLTIEAVAALADVSKPAVYYYFTSKEELSRALAMDRSRSEVEQLQQAIAATPEGASLVEAVVRAYVRHHLGSLHLFRAEYVYSQTLGITGEQADAEVNPGMIGMFDALEARLRADERAGRLQPGQHLRRVAFSTWAAAHGLVATLSLLDASGTRLTHQVEDMVGELSAMLTRGVYLNAPAQNPKRRQKLRSTARRG